MFINPLKFIKPILWLLTFFFVVYFVYVIGINIHAKLEYEHNNVARKFVSLIENPTDRVTEEEKNILKNITEGSGFFGLNFLDKSGLDEGKIKELRQMAEQNPIKTGELKIMGQSQKNGTMELTLTNSFKNPKSKTAKIYLQEYGNWYLTGYRWRIFQIDMPEKDSPLNTVVDNIKETQQGLWDNIRNFGKSSSSSSTN